MKLAIHKSSHGFHPSWVAYCKEENIPYKLVNCYDSDIIKDLEDCDALLWHHHHFNPKDILFAKQLLFSLEMSGKVVFPNFNTGWHFDDKVGQKYLIEALDLPMVPSYVFYNKQEALEWATNTNYPKIWKLRGGAGGSNVSIVKNKKQANKLINVAFKDGFKQYNAFKSLEERWKKFRNNKVDFLEVCKGIGRLFKPPIYSRIAGKEIGYIYFQEFIPNNDYDIRLIVIGGKYAYGLRRINRAGDFRASGSSEFGYGNIPNSVVKIAFEASQKLDSTSCAFDFIFDEKQNPLIIEISYGFGTKGSSKCPGYWTSDLQWHEEKFNPFGWIIQDVLEKVKMKSR